MTLDKISGFESAINMVLETMEENNVLENAKEQLDNVSIDYSNRQLRFWLHFKNDFRAEFIDGYDFVTTYHWTNENGWEQVCLYPNFKYRVK